MRVSINVEFTPEEIKQHAADFARRYTMGLVGDLNEHLPSMASTLGAILAQALSVVSEKTPQPYSTGPVPCDGCGDNASSAPSDVGPFATQDAPPRKKRRSVRGSRGRKSSRKPAQEAPST